MRRSAPTGAGGTRATQGDITMHGTTKRAALAGALLAIGLLLLSATPAGAQGYSGGLELRISRFRMCICERNEAEAVGFAPGTEVTFTVYSEPLRVGTVTADDRGVASLTFGLPDDFELGSHSLEATGSVAADGGLQPGAVRVDFEVYAPGEQAPVGPDGDGTGRDPLARTGTDLALPLRIALLALAAGAALLLASRKRQSGSAAA